MSKSKIEVINVLVELDRIGYKYDPAGDNELRCLCPVHEHDGSTPSCSINTEKRLFNCKSAQCKAEGDFVTFLAHFHKVERSVVLAELATRYDLEELKTINPLTVEKFHEEIWAGGPLVGELKKRGITDDMIRKARLGIYNKRITIPIYDLHQNVINIRRYMPGAPGPEKFRNTTGYGAPALYQIEQVMRFDTIWICGGEMKALVAGWYLNEFGIGACAPVGGEGVWEMKWNQYLKGKTVYLVYDVDAAGKAAARKIAQAIYRSCKAVFIVTLPLDRTVHPKGDINDFVGGGARGPELKACMADAKEFTPTILTQTKPGEVVDVSLSRSTHPSNIGKRLRFEAISAAKDTTPFLIPKKVTVMCNRKDKNCPMCPIITMDPAEDTGGVEMTIPATASGILSMVDSPMSQQVFGISEGLGIPSCKSVQYNVKSHYRVTDTRLAPQLSIGSEGSNNVLQSALIVDNEVELNTPYKLTGVVYPHPKNQQAVLIIDDAEETSDNLASFQPSPTELESLRAFTPKGDLTEHINTIYNDIAANVSHIFGRNDIHLVIDLTYHSALIFNFDKRLVTGWVNSLIIGDSSQGKSETSLRLMEHYGLGERVELKSATAAGLIGGLQQLGNRWFVSWGIIPTHDRRLVILEEVKGADPEILGKLTDMRSSGIAEIPKIERRRAHARTRLIFISNPRSSRNMASYNFGVEAIKELIGSLEDIRRFDVALCVSAKQIDPTVINAMSTSRPDVPHVFTQELSRRLVLYAWTRRPEHIKFEEGLEAQILQETVRLCTKFSETLPLVDRGTMRYKIARLAVALAIRTFSTGESLEEVLVRKAHVEYIVKMLDRLYCDPICGYKDFSTAQTQAEAVIDAKVVRGMIRTCKFPADFVRQTLYRDEVTLADIQDWCELDIDEARRFMSFFIRKHCLYRHKNYYTKTADFIALLKAMELEGVPEKAEAGDAEM